MATVGVEMPDMRNYIPNGDELQDNDFDVYYEIPARTAKDLAVRVYIKIERDPERAQILGEQQGAAIFELLRWARDHRAQLRTQEHKIPDPDQNE